MSLTNAEDTPAWEVIKDSIRRVGTEDEGAPVSEALTHAATTSDKTRETVEHEFEEMKKRGEVYVVPREDAEDHVKVTP